MGKGKGCFGCCEGETGKSVQTYAEDSRDPVDMGLPESIHLDNPSRRIITSDCPMCLVFIVFWVGMFIVAGEAFSKGDPLRLVYGSDYLGNMCGKGAEPEGWDNVVIAVDQSRAPFQSKVWSENTYLWFPVPYTLDQNLTEETSSAWDAKTALARAVCVKTCPQWGMFSANGTNKLSAVTVQSDPVLYSRLNKVHTYGNPDREYLVWYDSHEVLRRCLPSSGSSQISSLLNTAIDDIPGVTRVTNWFTRGLADMENAYLVVVYCGIIGIVLPFLFILILRLLLKPVVWIMLICMFLGMILTGYLSYKRWDRLENDDDSENDDDAKGWLGLCILSWVFAALFLCFLVWFRKQINAACEIIQHAGRVLTSDPTLLLVPIITGITIGALAVWIIYVSLYVWTIEEEVFDANGTLIEYNSETTKNNMLYYNFFGWLWTMGVFSALGYFVVAAATVQWYYSHQDDDHKKIPFFLAWLRGYMWAFLYHLGCLITGALLVAILQMIRFIIQRATEKLKNSSSTIACLLCIVDCCLAYVERILQYISRNAYIMTAIEGSGFWCSCCKVISVLLGSIEYLAPLILVSDVVFFLGKVFLVAGNVAIGYLLLESSEVAPNVDNGILVLFVVGIIAWLLASLFLNVYEAAIDSMFVLIFHENGQPKDPSLFFCPADVFKTVTGKSKGDAAQFKADFGEKAAKGKGGTEPAAEAHPSDTAV